MALSYIGYASAAATSVSLPAFTAGDLALVCAYRDGSNTAPSLPTGWTNIASSGANTNSSRVGYRVLQVGDTTTGVWTNATEVQVLVLRGQHVAPIGASVVPGGASDSSQITYGPVQIFGTPTTSWVVAFAGHRTATNVNTATAATTSNSYLLQEDGTSHILLEDGTGALLLEGVMTNRSVASATSSIVAHTQANSFAFNSGTGEYWFEATSFAVNAASAWRSYAFEVVAATANTKQTTTAVVSLASGGMPVARTGHALNIRARKTNAAHTGVMRVQLFENNTPRTALLSTSALTTTLTNYQLPITEAEATSIGSYAELEVRFEGYSSEGTATVFEVDQVWLQIPEASGAAPSVFPGIILFTLVEEWAIPSDDTFPAPTLFPSETSP